MGEANGAVNGLRRWRDPMDTAFRPGLSTSHAAQLYDKVIALSESRHALPTLAAVSFAESSFFPIPPDVMLVPMVLANRQRRGSIALVHPDSVLGGMLGYAIGLFLYDTRRPLDDRGLRLWRGRSTPSARPTPNGAPGSS